jgi:uncharacterized protein involved in cysteine biosynthesis
MILALRFGNDMAPTLPFLWPRQRANKAVEKAMHKEALRFFGQHFFALLPFFLLPLLGAFAITGGLLGGSFWALDWVAEFVAGGREGWWVPLVVWTLRVLGLLLGIFLAYLFFGPLTRLVLGPFLGLFAERVYAIRRGIPLDETPMFSGQFIANLMGGFILSIKLVFAQLPLTLLGVFLALLIPGGALISWVIDFFTNTRFVPLDNFSLLFFAGKDRVRSIGELKKRIQEIPMPAGSLGSFRFWGAFWVSIPFVNIAGMLLNACAAALLVADHHKAGGKA